MSGWAWDSPKEREMVEDAYIRMLHQQKIDDEPDYIPRCSCHPLTREARLWLSNDGTTGELDKTS